MVLGTHLGSVLGGKPSLSMLCHASGGFAYVLAAEVGRVLDSVGNRESMHKLTALPFSGSLSSARATTFWDFIQLSSASTFSYGIGKFGLFLSQASGLVHTCPWLLLG